MPGKIFESDFWFDSPFLIKKLRAQFTVTKTATKAFFRIATLNYFRKSFGRNFVTNCRNHLNKNKTTRGFPIRFVINSKNCVTCGP